MGAILRLRLGQYENEYTFTYSSLDAIKKAGTQTWDTLLYVSKYMRNTLESQ